MKCKCGKELIFTGGYVQASIKIDLYKCYSCNITYEKVEDNHLIHSKK